MRLPVMDRFLNRISEEELKEQRESAGEDDQFLDLKYQEVDGILPLDISRDYHGERSFLRAGSEASPSGNLRHSDQSQM